MSRLSLRNLAGLFRWLNLRIRAGVAVRGLFFLDKRREVYIGSNGSLSCGGGVVVLHDFTARIEAPVTVGSEVFFNRGCHVVVKDGLDIGDSTLIGEYVSIHDETHTIVDKKLEGPNSFVAQRIRIGRGVWVGAHSTILKGVTIGDHSIIGANSVVTKDVPAGTIAAGTPARIIKEVTDT